MLEDICYYFKVVFFQFLTKIKNFLLLTKFFSSFDVILEMYLDFNCSSGKKNIDHPEIFYGNIQSGLSGIW